MRRRISPPIANDIARIFPESILNLGLCQPAQQIMTSIIGRPQYIYRQVDYRLPFFGRRQPLGTSSTSEYIIALHPNIDIIRRPHREAGLAVAFSFASTAASYSPAFRGGTACTLFSVTRVN